MAEHAVTSSDQAHALAAHLQDPARAAPVVVVSVAAGQREPYVDSVELSAELAGLAELYVLPTGPISWAFAAQMPDHTEVYGGAARVYPIGVEWVHDVRRSPLRFAYGPGDQTRVTEAVITDAMAAAASLVTRAAPTSHTRVAGRVAGDVGGRVLVTLDSGQVRMATIWPELVVEGVNAERLFIPDMPVDGVLDMQRRRLDVTGMRVPASRALAAYTPGAVVLGRVRYVERTLCVVELFPGVEASIDAADAFTGEVVDLRTVMSEGETLPVRVTAPGDGDDDWELTLGDVDPDDAVLPAPAVLRGGPPWLLLPHPGADAGVDTSTSTSTSPALPLTVGSGRLDQRAGDNDGQPQEVQPDDVHVDASPATGVARTRIEPSGERAPLVREAVQDDALSRERELFVALEAMTAERDALLAQLRAERSRARTGEAATAQLRTQLRQIRERATRAQRQLAGALGGDPAANDGALFADPEGQLRFEVDLAWARRTTPDEKPHLPLAPWSTGEGFFVSWEQVQGVDRGKVVDVIVDVLTGRASWMEGRQAHPLRAGVAGNAKPLTRNDGAVCWRVSLQTNSPSARRLHYWVLEGGSIELASVRLHDDMRP